jgi:phytoene synthase
MWLLDERMGAIVAAAREPAIGAMRLLWWRDALEALDRTEAPAEPLLGALAREALARGVDGATLAGIEEGWAALLDDEEPGDEAILLHARARGGRLFTACATLLGGRVEDIAAAGEAWALADLGHRLRAPEARAFARAQASVRLADVAITRWPVRLRPLGLLALLAGRDARMAAGTVRRQGSPGRVLRAMLYGLTGR